MGHQRVILQAQDLAKQLGLSLTVLLFEPQPKEFFAEKNGPEAPARLMSLRTKVSALESLGVDVIWCLKFSSLRPMTAESFVRDLVVNKQVAQMVVGDDFRFGCDRQGDFSYLIRQGARFGFSIEQTATHRVGGFRISSSRIRHLLMSHDFDSAKRLLGRRYALCGRVIYGQQLGRKIGFPTANIALSNSPPIRGVFGCTVTLPDRQVIRGVANIGSRPTVSGQQLRLEVHLHEFTGELYGQMLLVTPLVFIRAERKFDSLDALTEQIRIDNDVARQLLGSITGFETE